MPADQSPSFQSVEVAYPFSAVTGQDDYKLALLANAVDPLIGGVLAIGGRGTAKSTLARSFSSMLVPPDAAERAPFVEVPIGTTIDRLTGALDSAALLAGEGVKAKVGLLQQSDGGVLYVDEVNLLGDHLVDAMLDAAAFGVVRTEREEISQCAPARFVLIGTMNPEEGALRPQLLDRFGLSVSVEAPTEADERERVVANRLEFDRNPQGFRDRFLGTEVALQKIVVRARGMLPDVALSKAQTRTIAEVCIRLGVDGMRADLVTAHTARALAALDQRQSVGDIDIETAARLALPHRATGSSVQVRRYTSDEIAQAFDPDGHSAVQQTATPTPKTSAGRRTNDSNDCAAATEDTARPKADSTADSPLVDRIEASGSPLPGRSGTGHGGEKPVVDRVANEQPADLDVVATARAAVTRRLFGGSAPQSLAPSGSDVMSSAPGEIRAADLRERVRVGREANLVLCVVDASSSVLTGGRVDELRALLGGLTADAKRRRDRVGLIVFRGRDARLVAPPSRNHAAVLAGLETIDPGGTTPLAEGIRVAHETALREIRRNPDLRPVVTLVTDGYANVARSGDALAEARAAAHDLRSDAITLVVIGESTSAAPQFAQATGSEFYPFDPPDEQQERRSVA